MSTLRRRTAASAAYLGTFLATLDISIVNVALPTIQTDLQTDIAGLQWVVNAYAICLSAFMLSAGPAADRHGHKRCWLVGLVLFTIGSAICGWAGSLPVLLAGRALQGLSAAFLISGAMPILTHLFSDPVQRAHVIGGWSAFTALALILGPLLGGLLLDSFGWQSIFLINLPLGVLAFGLGVWGIPERKYPDHAALDPLGQILSIFSLGLLAYGMIMAGEQGMAKALPVVLLALLGFVLFAVVEKRVQRPLVPLRLFAQSDFLRTNAASFILGLAYYSSLFFTSIFLQQIQGWEPAEAGWRMMPQFVVTGVVSFLFGRLSAWIPIRYLMLAGYALTGLALGAMVCLSADTAYWLVAVLFALLGAGAGLAVPASGILIMGMAPPEATGSVSATMNALRQAGMTVGIALLGALMSQQAILQLQSMLAQQGVEQASALAKQVITQHVFPDAVPGLNTLYVQSMQAGFHAAMLAGALSCVVALVLLWRVVRPKTA